MTDISTALSTAVLKDGTQTITNDIPMNTHKFTAMAAGSAATDSVRLSQVQSGAYLAATTVGGTGNAITLAFTPPVTTLANGLRLSFVATAANSAAATVTVDATLANRSITWPSQAALAANAILNQALVVIEWNATTGTFHMISVTSPPPYWQTVTTVSGASTTGTTLIPWDDTIPQITEGDEYMTLAINPKVLANQLIIRVVFNYAYSISDQITVALFQDATANALAATSNWASAGGDPQQIVLTHKATVTGSLASITFRVRAGGANAGTLTFNGAGGNRKLGGVNASSITIDEVSP